MFNGANSGLQRSVFEHLVRFVFLVFFALIVTQTQEKTPVFRHNKSKME
jgi:hypothetical protein